MSKHNCTGKSEHLFGGGGQILGVVDELVGATRLHLYNKDIAAYVTNGPRRRNISPWMMSVPIATVSAIPWTMYCDSGNVGALSFISNNVMISCDREQAIRNTLRSSEHRRPATTSQ